MRGAMTRVRLAAAALGLAGLLCAAPILAQDTNGIIVYQSDFGLKVGDARRRGPRRPDAPAREPDP